MGGFRDFFCKKKGEFLFSGFETFKFDHFKCIFMTGVFWAQYYGQCTFLHSRPGRCLLQWINDGSIGVKSFVHGLNLRPIDAEDKGFDPT